MIYIYHTYISCTAVAQFQSDVKLKITVSKLRNFKSKQM